MPVQLKTEFMVIGSRQKLLAESHNEINIKLEDQVISNVDHAKSLGLIIDNRLSWSNHVNELCKKVTSAIGALRRIRPLISQSTAVLYNNLPTYLPTSKLQETCPIQISGTTKLLN